MGIVISILKTVGIILLIILAVLLVLLCMVLFVPVRYRAKGEIPAEGRPHGLIRLTWLLSFISCSLEYDEYKYENKYLMQLKICGIRFRGKQKVPKASEDGEEKDSSEGGNAEKQPEAEEKQEKAEKLPEKNTADGQSREEEGGADAGRREDAKPGENQEAEAKDAGCGEKEEKAQAPERETDGEEGTKEKESWLIRFENMLSSVFKAFKETFQNIQYTIDKLCDKIKQIRDNIDYYMDVFSLDETRLVLNNVYGEAGRLLKHLGPRKMKVNFIVGTGEPASTGQILAIHAMLYPVIGETVHISPDFEKPRLEGEFDIRGRVRFAVALIAVLRIILDKKTWSFVRRLKKEEMTNGRKK